MKIRKVLGIRPTALLMAQLWTTVILVSSGYGCGVNPNLRYTPRKLSIHSQRQLDYRILANSGCHPQSDHPLKCRPRL